MNNFKHKGYIIALLLFTVAFFLSSSPAVTEAARALFQPAESRPVSGELSGETGSGSDTAAPDPNGSGMPQRDPDGVPEGTAATVPVLMYHAFTAGSSAPSDLYVTQARFRQQLQALQSAGYSFVTCKDLQNFVSRGTPLPQNPILLTCDDGYLDNYLYAYPVLQELNARMTIFTVGISIGKDTYRDTSQAINPHFSFAQAAEMSTSGLVEIGSHTYDMHRWPALETGEARHGMEPLSSETKETYLPFAESDLRYMYQQLSLVPGSNRTILAYPQGANHPWAQEAAANCGMTLTCTTQKGTNTLVVGDPNTLLNLNRYTVTDDLTGGKLLQLLTVQ